MKENGGVLGIKEKPRPTVLSDLLIFRNRADAMEDSAVSDFMPSEGLLCKEPSIGCPKYPRNRPLSGGKQEVFQPVLGYRAAQDIRSVFTAPRQEMRWQEEMNHAITGHDIRLNFQYKYSYSAYSIHYYMEDPGRNG